MIIVKKAARWAIALSAASMISGTAFAKGGAGILVSLNTMYSDSKTESTTSGITSTAKANSMNTDLNLGYQMMSGLYLGLLYVTESGTSGSTKSSVSGYGPSIGYMASNGFFIHGHYIMSAELDDDTSTTTKFKKGTGPQVDFGYMMPISSSANIGLQLTYKDVKYASYYNGTADVTTTTLKATEMYPKIRFGFMF